MRAHSAQAQAACPGTYTRRNFFGRTAKTLLTAGSVPLLSWMIENDARATEVSPLTNFRQNRNDDPWVLSRIPGADLKPIVVILLDGGADQESTFDPKPDATEAYRGPFSAIRTSETRNSGLMLSELLPKIARRAGEYRFIRCLQSTNLDHGPAATLATTGSARQLNDDANNQKRTPRWDGGHVHAARYYSQTGLGAVVLGAHDEFPYGAMQGNHTDVEYVQCDLSNNNTYPSPFPSGANIARARRVLNLSRQFGSVDNNVYGDAGRQYDRVYQNAERIMGGGFHRAFDPNVPRRDREQVGEGPFANAVVVTRRLIESGAPFVLIDMSNWDTHNNMESELRGDGYSGPGLGTQLDNGLDYLQRTIGDRAIIGAFGEFGRTPRVNGSAGRDHFGRAFSMVVTGSGVNGGVTGATNRNGTDIVSDERYNIETALEALLNLGGLMRVQVNRNNGEVPRSPVRFPTQSWAIST